mmetsp:Transcript_57508/g.149469  ORF Transcript_57508/g.149469 Transcript_57508/m.149469 type:complete len:245 (-) Transcript_57508:579-1313(-)
MLMGLLVAADAMFHESCVHHFDEVVGRLMELVHSKRPAVEGVDVPLVLAGKRMYRSPRGLPKREVVHVMGDVRERKVQCPVRRVRRLEMHCPWHTSGLQVSRNSAALRKHLVVRGARVQVALGHLLLHETDEGIWSPRASVADILLSRLRSAAVHPHVWEAVYLLLPAGVLEIDAIDLQDPDVGHRTICILGFIDVLIHAILEIPPDGAELSAMRAPICIEVDHGEVMSINDGLKAVVLEIITG